MNIKFTEKVPNSIINMEELNKLNKLKLVDQKGELLLECRIGD